MLSSTAYSSKLRLCARVSPPSTRRAGTRGSLALLPPRFHSTKVIVHGDSIQWEFSVQFVLRNSFISVSRSSFVPVRASYVSRQPNRRSVMKKRTKNGQYTGSLLG